MQYFMNAVFNMAARRVAVTLTGIRIHACTRDPIGRLDES